MSQELIQNCQQIKQVVDAYATWVKNNVDATKQGVHINNLKRFRRTAKRYENAASKRPSIALFGQSQVGKSYLVSNIGKMPTENVQYVIDEKSGAKISFIQYINPAGGGKESTGLVTRFSIHSQAKGTKPITIKLLSQSDLVRILTNGYLSDIKEYTYSINPSEINSRLQSLKSQLSSSRYSEFSEDDVYDVKEYLDAEFKDSFIVRDLNKTDFWEEIAEIVPYLRYDNRWQVFEFLWGKQPFLTKLFNLLSEGLRQVDFSAHLGVGFEALIPREVSIIDVQRYYELFDSDTEFNQKIASVKQNMDNASKAFVSQFLDLSEVSATLKVETSEGRITAIHRNVLAAVTAELCLTLPSQIAEHPQRTFLKDADILDFPGARSRHMIPEVTFVANDEKKKLEIFLRGKIAYLFEQFNHNLEISTLVFCQSNDQPNVTYLPKLISNWVKLIHGENAEAREKREQKLSTIVNNRQIDRIIPLLFVNTKFNIEIKGNGSETLGNSHSHDYKWEARVKANFHEFYAKSVDDKWMQNWNQSDKTFKNVFFLRDPNFSTDVFDGINPISKEGTELNIRDLYVPVLNDMRTSFINHEYVRKHVRYPEECWSETSTLNKSGIDYIVKYLVPTTDPIIKIEQVKDLISNLKKDILREIDIYYEDNDVNESMRKANINSVKVVTALVKMQQQFGQFLNKLMLREELAWNIYFKLVNEIHAEEGDSNATTPTSSGKMSLIEYARTLGLSPDENSTRNSILEQIGNEIYGGIDIKDLIEILKEEGIDLEDVKPPKRKDRADILAERLIKAWIDKLDNLRQPGGMESLGIRADIMDLIIDQLLKNMIRVNLMEHLAGLVREEVKNYHPTINPNWDIIARISSAVVNQFIMSVGWSNVAEVERPKAKVNEEKRIFSHNGLRSPNKQNLQFTNSFPGQELYENWRVGIRESFLKNALGSFTSAERAIANAELGEIRKKINSGK